MMVYVVMGNDFPDAVFSRLDEAESYCLDRRNRDKAEQFGRRIYWRTYDFELDAKREATPTLNSPMTLLERIARPIRFDALKHDLWRQRGFNDVEEYVVAEINDMTTYDLLVAISEALSE